jgi:hypothetical protein
MLALSVMYIPNCMIFYFCITWLPTYLLERHGFNISGMALFAGLPLLVSIPGDLLGGWLTDRLSGRYGLRVGRCGLGGAAYIFVGLSLIAAGTAPSPVLAAVLIAAATGVTMFTLGAAWGTAIEIGGNHVGVVGGTMNSIGNLVAMLNPLIVALFGSVVRQLGRAAVHNGGPLSRRRRLLDRDRSPAARLRAQPDRYSRSDLPRPSRQRRRPSTSVSTWRWTSRRRESGRCSISSITSSCRKPSSMKATSG